MSAEFTVPQHLYIDHGAVVREVLEHQALHVFYATLGAQLLYVDLLHLVGPL